MYSLRAYIHKSSLFLLHWLFPKSFNQLFCKSFKYFLLPFYFSVLKSKLFYYLIHVNFWQIREATLFALSSLSEQLFETEVWESYFSCEFWYVELEIFISILNNLCFHFVLDLLLIQETAGVYTGDLKHLVENIFAVDSLIGWFQLFPCHF